MPIVDGKVVIHATMMNPEEIIREHPDEGLEYDRCMVCGKAIERKEREPRGVVERVKAKWFGRKFWSWNVAAYYGKKIVCSRPGCYAKFIWERAEKRVRK